MKKKNLKKFIEEYPGLANVPIIIHEGKCLTAKEAVKAYSPRLVKSLSMYETDNNRDYDVGTLAEDFYKRIIENKKSSHFDYIVGDRVVTMKEAVECIRNKDDIGIVLIKAYKLILNHIKI